jgi:uncharacterized protein YpmS
MKEATKKTPQRKKWKVTMFFVIGILFILLTGNIILNRVIQKQSERKPYATFSVRKRYFFFDQC